MGEGVAGGAGVGVVVDVAAGWGLGVAVGVGAIVAVGASVGSGVGIATTFVAGASMGSGTFVCGRLAGVSVPGVTAGTVGGTVASGTRVSCGCALVGSESPLAFGAVVVGSVAVGASVSGGAV